MTTGKTIALTRWTFVGKIMCLLFNMLSRLLIAFLPRNKYLLIPLGFTLISANLENSEVATGLEKVTLSSQGSGFSSGHVWM